MANFYETLDQNQREDLVSVFLEVQVYFMVVV